MSDKPFTIGDWQQWTVYNGAPVRCWYDGKTFNITCNEATSSRIIHDARGCFHVCKAHCDWRATCSVAAGHHHCPESKS